MQNNAIVMLEDGVCLLGTSFGMEGFFVGKVIFNTSITGDQEILGDLFHSGQMISIQEKWY